ncbi:extracellular solute-binding protein [Ruminiclostridium cellulolyticum]|uniref:Extracellular solute-binding protein family 1 n=1 Tax=Ruminiclostridium cellulolyticum (strain ATCC 35319 / DSM 5812 / JCM 6584 / H10) TaxID=394503 RepID=B8I9C7_RUMCH|nr:extracellular solute-binding protein [Ruminiclostridium cellulolyticum]ACL75387.1 extracellular solute-binding protein family 1 [Ruminiclostridium cellulolyticum H10]
MKMHKILVSTILSVAMLLSITACGSNDAGSGDKAQSTGTTSADTNKENKGTTKLTMWHIQTQENVADIIDASMDRFAKDNPGFEMEAVPMQNDPYKTKLITAMSANELPDVFIHWTGGPMISYIDSGAVYDITEYMNKDNYKDKFLDASIQQATYKDSIWAVPVENVSPALMFYNKKLFADNGIEVPKTLDEFEKVSDTFVQKGIIPVSLANKTKWPGSIVYGYVLDRIAGPNAFADANNGVTQFDTPDFLAAATKIQTWAKKGYFGKDFNGMDYDAGQDRQLFYNGKAAMYIMGGWFLFTAKGENPEFVENVGVMQFPANPDSKGKASEYIGTMGDNFYSVSKNSKNPEMAFKAITYMLDDQAVKERIESGKIPPLKGITLTDEISKIVSDSASSATSMQLWLDQYLAPNDAELHKDQLQKLLAGSITPEQYNKSMTDGVKNK